MTGSALYQRVTRPGSMEVEILTKLSECMGGGGYSIKHIAEAVSYSRFNKRARSAAVRHRLVDMMSVGWVQLLDADEPRVYCITATGREALARVKKHDGNPPADSEVTP